MLESALLVRKVCRPSILPITLSPKYVVPIKGKCGTSSCLSFKTVSVPQTTTSRPWSLVLCAQWNHVSYSYFIDPTPRELGSLQDRQLLLQEYCSSGSTLVVPNLLWLEFGIVRLSSHDPFSISKLTLHSAFEYTYLLFWNSFWTIAPVLGIGLFDRIVGTWLWPAYGAICLMCLQMLMFLWPFLSCTDMVANGRGSL